MKTIQLSVLLLAGGPSAASPSSGSSEVGGGSFLRASRSRVRWDRLPPGFRRAFLPARLGQNLYPHISGELRYEFLQSNLSLQSGGNRSDLLRRGARGPL